MLQSAVNRDRKEPTPPKTSLLLGLKIRGDRQTSKGKGKVSLAWGALSMRRRKDKLIRNAFPINKLLHTTCRAGEVRRRTI